MALIQIQWPFVVLSLSSLICSVLSVPTEGLTKPFFADPSSWEDLSDGYLARIAGTHVIFSWPGPTIPDELIDLTSEGKVGGIIIFGENVADDLPSQISELQEVYRSSPSYTGHPLLITTDQEGGFVARLPGGPSLSAKEIGASADPPAEARKAGRQAAEACKAYGVNANLAPVLDVYREEGNFDDQFNRSYSMDPAVVEACGSAFVEAQQDGGVKATCKHFPGLGAAVAQENTDEVAVKLGLGLEEIWGVDEVPFRGAITVGTSMIMPSWAVYPALDSKWPAGLSSKWIRDELRGRLEFEGVVISDALEAGALDTYGGDAERAVKAIQAGQDVVLASARNVSQGVAAVDGIVEALKEGKIDCKDFARSTARVLALRKA